MILIWSALEMEMWDCAIWLEPPNSILPYLRKLQMWKYISISTNRAHTFSFLVVWFPFWFFTSAKCFKPFNHFILTSNSEYVFKCMQSAGKWKYDLHTVMNAITRNYLEMSLLLMTAYRRSSIYLVQDEFPTDIRSETTREWKRNAINNWQTKHYAHLSLPNVHL